MVGSDFIYMCSHGARSILSQEKWAAEDRALEPFLISLSVPRG